MFCENCSKNLIKLIKEHLLWSSYLVIVRAFDSTVKGYYVRCLPVIFSNFWKKVFPCEPLLRDIIKKSFTFLPSSNIAKFNFSGILLALIWDNAKTFMRSLKAFIKSFEVPQRSKKILFLLYIDDLGTFLHLWGIFFANIVCGWMPLNISPKSSIIDFWQGPK